MTKTFLDRAYDLDAPERTRAFYADWSESYDEEVSENGYATPRRAAILLAARVDDKDAPLLDLGCGTGISGTSFHDAGFTTIDGTDLSPEMLAKAEAKGVYRSLQETDAADPLPFDAGLYPTIAAIGVFSPGHAPPDTIDHVLNKLTPGGRFVFSFNDHTLEDPAYEGRVREWADCGAVMVEAREEGDHLPRIGIKSVVYVLRRL